MNTTLCKVYYLTFLVCVMLRPSDGQSKKCSSTKNCCGDSCDAPPPLNVPLKEIFKGQPLYVTLYPAIPLFAGVDNVCYTLFPLPDGTYLFIFSVVYANGHNSRMPYILSSKEPGVLSIASTSCTTTNTIFEYVQTQNCNMYIGYICKYYGDCPLIPGNDIPILALSPNGTAISMDCLEQAKKAIRRAGVPDQDYFILPMELDSACVTEIPCLSYSN